MFWQTGVLHYSQQTSMTFPPDATYADPLGDLPPRPKTASKRQQEDDDFQNAELDDDLLPE